MQVGPTDLQPGDTIVVMSKCVARVLASERVEEADALGARRITIEVVGVWSAYDQNMIPAGAKVERISQAWPDAIPTDAGGNGGYA